VNSKPT